MLIFVFPSVFPNKLNLGAGTFVYEQSKSLKHLGHELVVLNATEYNYKHWFNKDCRTIETKTDESLGIIYEHHTRGLMQSRLPKLACKIYHNNVTDLFKLAVKQNGIPDVIIAHFSFTAGFSAVEIAKQYNVPCVIVEHYSYFLQEKIHPYIKKSLINTVKDADAFICVSENLKSMIEQHTGIKDKVIVIPNMVDSKFTYSPLSQNTQFIFFGAGNLVPSKRFDLLIQAFINAFGSDEDIILRIAGGGQEYDKLAGIIESSCRTHQIKLLGQIGRNQILMEYQNSNCFVLPSSYETFGIVYREAMAVGRPVISTKHGGIVDNWDDSFGLLTKIDDVDDLSNALIKMKNNYAYYDGKSISEKCLDIYNSKTIINSIENILFRVLDEY